MLTRRGKLRHVSYRTWYDDRRSERVANDIKRRDELVVLEIEEPFFKELLTSARDVLETVLASFCAAEVA